MLRSHLARRARATACSRLLVALQAAGLVFLCGGNLAAQQDNGVIYGRVTDSRGHPQNQRVQLLAAGDIPADDVYTDTDGQYTFRSLPSGEYWVVVEAQGFEPVRRAVMLDTHISARMQVNLVLEEPRVTSHAASPTLSGSASSRAVDARNPAPSFAPQAVRELDKGIARQKKGDLEGAIAHYEKAVDIDPHFYPALNNLGAAYEHQGDHRRAEEVLLKSLAINPDDGQSYINLGHVFYEEGRYPEARAQLEEGVKRTPDSASGYFLLGSTFLRLGELDKAATNLKQALTLDPKGMPRAHLQLANLYLKQHEMTAASSELQAYLRANPSDPQAPAIKKMLASIAANQTN
jgi:tetratricopeptide (TPR) repeat protein